jgi:hypothetical protein
MKYSTGEPHNPFLEARADEDDHIDVRIQSSVIHGEMVLYLDVNGITIARIAGIKREVEVNRSDFDEQLVEAFMADIEDGSDPKELRKVLIQGSTIASLDEAVRRLEVRNA